MEVRPGYKHTDLGLIPEDWKVASLGDIFFFSGGYSASRDQLGELGHCYLHYGDIHMSPKSYVDVKTQQGDIPKIDIRLADVSKKSLLDEGDVVFVDASEDDEGTSRHNVVVNPRGVPFISGLHTIVAKPKNHELQDGYKRHCFQAPHVKAQFRFYSAGTKVCGISKTNIAKVLIPIPTYFEQEAIAEALSDAETFIESLGQLIAKKRQIKQGAMQGLLTGKKRLPGFSGEWEVKRLGDHIELFVGGGTPSRSNPDYWGGDISWVTVKDFTSFDPGLTQETITKEGLNCSASHLVPRGTLITSTRMALGKAVIYDVDVAINQDLKALFPNPELVTEYLYFWFQYFGRTIGELGSGSTVKGVSLPDLKKVVFVTPQVVEQKAIVAILSDMDAEIAALETKLAKARQIKQGMMQELLTGRIRLVSVPGKKRQ